MRILFLTENFPPETNAAATRVHERACYWASWGHQVTILTSAPNFPQGLLYEGYKNRWRQIETMDGIQVVRVKTYIAKNRGTFRRTADFISFMLSSFCFGFFEKSPDVIVSTSPQFFAAVAGWALGAFRRVPFVFELGDLWPASIVAVGAIKENSVIRQLEKLELFLYRQSDAVIALTNSFRENLISRGIPSGKIAVVINGVDLPRYAPRDPDPRLLASWNPENRFLIGYFGTHGMAHGLQNVLEAAERLRSRKEIAFLLVGAGAEREDLIADANRRELKNVIFMPTQPKEMMPSVLSLCHVALVHLRNSPVFRDVIPSKMFEAMGMALPILMVTPKGEASEILEKVGAGVHVNPEDPDALAAAVIELADNTERREQFANRSQQAAPRHSRETQAAHMVAILEEVVLGNGAHVAKIPRPILS